MGINERDQDGDNAQLPENAFANFQAENVSIDSPIFVDGSDDSDDAVEGDDKQDSGSDTDSVDSDESNKQDGPTGQWRK